MEQTNYPSPILFLSGSKEEAKKHGVVEELAADDKPFHLVADVH